jgi:hypothetical protein
VADTKAVAADMQVAVVVDTTAADATKLLLHLAAVCTTDGGANQLRRFALASPFASRLDGQEEKAACFAPHRDGARPDQLWLVQLWQDLLWPDALDLMGLTRSA